MDVRWIYDVAFLLKRAELSAIGMAIAAIAGDIRQISEEARQFAKLNRPMTDDNHVGDRIWSTQMH